MFANKTFFVNRILNIDFIAGQGSMRLTVKQTITCVFADLVCGFVRELTMVLLTDLFNTSPAGTAGGKEQENGY